MTKFVHSKRVVCSVYSKSLKVYERGSRKDVNLQRQALAKVCKIDVLKDSAKFTGKHVYQILYLMKLRASRVQLYCKRDLGTDVFK